MIRRSLRQGAVAAFLAVGILACEASGPLSTPVEDSRPTLTVNGVELLTAPAGRDLGPAATASVHVDAPNSGAVSAGDATLSVPARAVAGPTTITMAAASSGADAYTFGPDGLRFRRPASLSIQVDVERLIAAGIDPADLAVAGASDGADDWQVLGGSYDAETGVVVVSVHHFSRYSLCVR